MYVKDLAIFFYTTGLFFFFFNFYIWKNIITVRNSFFLVFKILTLKYKCPGQWEHYKLLSAKSWPLLDCTKSILLQMDVQIPKFGNDGLLVFVYLMFRLSL